MIFFNIFDDLTNQNHNFIKSIISKLLQIAPNENSENTSEITSSPQFYSKTIDLADETNVDSRSVVNLTKALNAFSTTDIDTEAGKLQLMIQFINILNPTSSRLSNCMTSCEIDLRNQQSTRELAFNLRVEEKNRNTITYFWERWNNAPRERALQLLNTLTTKAAREQLDRIQLNLLAHQEMLDNGYMCWTTNVQNCSNIFLNHPDDNILMKAYNSRYVIPQILLNLLNQPSQTQDTEELNINNIVRQSFIDEITVATNGLEAEEKKEIQGRLEAINLNEYVKQNNVDTYEDKPVFSFFSKEYYSMIKTHDNKTAFENILIINSDPISFIPRSTASRSDRHQNDQGVFNHRSPFLYPGSTEEYIPIGSGCGVTFLNAHAKRPYSDEAAVRLKENIIAQIANSPNARTFGLLMNGFTKATTKKEFELCSITKKQTAIRKGFFIPTLVPIEYRDENFQIQKGYSFFLLNLTTTYQDLWKKKRSANMLKTFGNLYNSDGGLYFYNEKKYLEEIRNRLQSLITYSSDLGKSFQGLSPAEIKALHLKNLTTHKRINKCMQLSSNHFLDAYTSELNIPTKLKKRYKKVTKNYTALENKKKELKRIESANTAALKANLQSMDTYREYISNLENQITSLNAEIASTAIKCKDIHETLEANKELHQLTIKEYNAGVAYATEKKDYNQSQFFNNLYATEAIKVLSVTFEDPCEKKCYTYESSQEKILKLLEEKNTLKIKEIKFIINKPVRIAVDSGKKGSVLGGPYIVKANENRLEIALAYPSSLHGFVSSSDHSRETGRILVHPHAGSGVPLEQFSNIDFSLKTPLYRSACLGEAAPLIWDAFSKNDIKLILMSILTWVKNANSTDVWGRRYVHFLDYREPAINTSQDITNDDVDEFIVSMLEDASDIQESVTDQVLENHNIIDLALTPLESESQSQNESIDTEQVPDNIDLGVQTHSLTQEPTARSILRDAHDVIQNTETTQPQEEDSESYAESEYSPYVGPFEPLPSSE
jgi:hypothetical protein